MPCILYVCYKHTQWSALWSLVPLPECWSTFVLRTGKHAGPAHLWTAAEKEKRTQPFPQADQTSRHFARLLVVFLLLPHLLPSLSSIKETGIQIMIKWYSRTLVCHLLWHPAFWIKSLFLASTLRLPIIGLWCRDQTEYGFGNNPCPCVVTSNRVEYTINKYRMEKIKWVNEREGNSLGDLF